MIMLKTILAGVAVALFSGPTPVLFVGDSIALGSAKNVRMALSHQQPTINAVVGRQFSAAPPIIAEWVRHNDGPVVVELGANGPIRERDLEAVLNLTSGRRLVLVGTSVPRWWTERNNSYLRAASHLPNIRYVDWQALVNAHPGALGRDGVHPTSLGRDLLATAVYEALKQEG